MLLGLLGLWHRALTWVLSMAIKLPLCGSEKQERLQRATGLFLPPWKGTHPRCSTLTGLLACGCPCSSLALLCSTTSQEQKEERECCQ